VKVARMGLMEEKMIRIAIVILVLLVGCAMPPEPEPQFIGQYLSLETFKTDYPNLKELGRSQHGNYVKYLTLNGKILMARYDDKKGFWNITIRQPTSHEVEYYMSKGEWEFD
jgi:hypothetical protein